MIRPRVLVTRPWAEGRALTARLDRMGVEPVLAPVIAVEALPVVLPPEPIDALLVTSAHAAAGLSAQNRQALEAKPVFAVGAATAAAMRRDGFADVRVAGGDVAALVGLVRLTHPRRARLLYLCGRVRKPELAEALAADGHAIAAVESYEARPVAWGPETVVQLREAPPLAALHFSRRSATLFADAASRAGLGDVLKRAVHLCLSDDIAQALRFWAPEGVLVARRPTTDSLLQALATIVASAP